MLARKKRQIGICGVDAGCLIIIDPCYLKYLPDIDKNWDQFCEQVIYPKTQPPNQGGQISYGGGGVIVSSRDDGAFPVYAHYDEDGCITKVEIVFIGD